MGLEANYKRTVVVIGNDRFINRRVMSVVVNEPSTQGS